MPGSIEYSIDETAGFVRVQWVGQVPIADWARMMDQIQADPRFHWGMPFLSDRRQVTTSPTADEIRFSVEYFRSHYPKLGQTRWAILTTRGAVDFGMMRMGEILADELIVMGYFDDVESAERWLVER